MTENKLIFHTLDSKICKAKKDNETKNTERTC